MFEQRAPFYILLGILIIKNPKLAGFMKLIILNSSDKHMEND